MRRGYKTEWRLTEAWTRSNDGLFAIFKVPFCFAHGTETMNLMRALWRTKCSPD